MPVHAPPHNAQIGKAPSQPLRSAPAAVEPTSTRSTGPTVGSLHMLAPRELLRLQRQIGNAAVMRLLGSAGSAQRMMANGDAEVVLDETWLYRVSDTHPMNLVDDFGVAPPIYAAVFAASETPKDIQDTLIGFSQQSMGAWLYRFHPAGPLQLGNHIPNQYWKGSLTSGRETTVGAAAVATVEVKVGNAWRTVSAIQQQVAQNRQGAQQQ